MQQTQSTIYTVSVGIPAFNEEANIGYLLRDVLNQQEEGYRLEQVYVYSDGSTDATESIVCGIKDPRVELIIGPGRMGAAHGQNTIMERATSDALVLLNADIQIKDPLFLHKTTSLAQSGSDLVAVPHRALPAKTFFEGVLATGLALKDVLFESYRDGQNVYTCHGGARLFSKRLYTQMRFVKSVGEDAFSYLHCLSQGYTYSYINNTYILYRLSDNFADHRRQSTRFFKGKNNFGDIFGSETVRTQMSIPLSIYVRATYRALPIIIKKPIKTVLYVGLVLWLRLESCFGREASETWEIATSSKKLQ